MERIDDFEVNSILLFCYLPHHPVVKADDTLKVRVVFNASQLYAGCRSLNHFLHAGPKLQEEIVALLLRWSFPKFAFICDVEKMFCQFLMHPADQDWQRILWRWEPNESVQSFRLKTVTYGTACAVPFPHSLQTRACCT